MVREYRLLVADDDEAFRQTVCAVVRPFFEIIEARSGIEALRALERSRIDAALCDLQMPEASGLDVLKAFRALDVQRPALLMTANPIDTVAQEAARLALDGVLEKPFTRRQLLSTIAGAVSSNYHDADFCRRLCPPSA